jgi:hypothetical protein
MRKFEDEAKIAVTKELSQMHSHEAFTPQDINLLTYKQCHRPLESIMHVKHKQDNSEKARLCANGRK